MQHEWISTYDIKNSQNNSTYGTPYIISISNFRAEKKILEYYVILVSLLRNVETHAAVRNLEDAWYGHKKCRNRYMAHSVWS